MKRGNQPFTFKHTISSIFMLMTLAWLTVCLPYVNESQQLAKQQVEKKSAETDNSNPLSNTNEEKSEGGTSLLSEYLHEMPVLEHNFITLSTFYKCHPSSIYIAYHPELVIPPPEV